MTTKILRVPLWIVSSFNTTERKHVKSKPLTLKDAMAAEQYAKARGWGEIKVTSQNGTDFYERGKLAKLPEGDPFSCCGRKFRHADDCWVVGGNVDQPRD